MKIFLVRIIREYEKFNLSGRDNHEKENLKIACY